MHTFRGKVTWLVFGLTSILFTSSFATGGEDSDAHSLYSSIDASHYEKPPYDLFERGLNGLNQLKDSRNLENNHLLTLIDFRKSGNEKRLWVIDLATKKILYHSLVAHGRNSGELFASKFSNIPNSNQSSLGFYITGNTYIGKHGVSLILNGVENGINDKARARSIVMHGATYVSDSFIKRVGRLGRSFGCPAVPMDIYKELIKEIANGTCLFIYYPDESYLAKTTLGLAPDSSISAVSQ